MTHSYPHAEFGKGFGGSSLEPSCEECRQKVVGDLDERNFELLTGLSRREFERLLTAEYRNGMGLYNFWDGIMGMKALKAFARREELLARVKAGRHG